MAGDTLTFAAEARDATGYVLSARVVKWRSSVAAVLRFDQSGRAAAVKFMDQNKRYIFDASYQEAG